MNKTLKSSSNRRSGVSLFFFCLTMVFFYAPMLILILMSFNSTKSLKWSGFSLRWYYDLLFNSDQIWGSFLNTVIIALLSGVISTIIGTLGAIGIYWYKFRFKKYLQLVSYLPLILPEIIIGVALLLFFAGIKLQLGLFTILLAHITFNIPYVLFIVMARLSEFDYSIIEASYDLGAREIDTLLKVIIPMSLPGIISGFLMAITLSLDDFVITFFVAGPGSKTLPLEIYNKIRYTISPVINTISVVLILASVFLALASKKMYKYMFSKS
jgi:spermidine/putrescine transport system permease protein